jgi:hypothetical protein
MGFTNKARAKRIIPTLAAYVEVMDTDEGEYGAEPLEEQLSDLLTDLMHWADTHKIDFKGRLRVAENNHYNETKKRR